jgi:hypothetical protein
LGSDQRRGASSDLIFRSQSRDEFNRKPERLADLGAAVFAGSPSDFERHIAAETEKWGKVVRAAGLRAD